MVPLPHASHVPGSHSGRSALMLLVKTRVGPSKISGFGLIAAQFIPKGTPVWTLVRWFDLILTKDQFERTRCRLPIRLRFIQSIRTLFSVRQKRCPDFMWMNITAWRASCAQDWSRAEFCEASVKFDSYLVSYRCRLRRESGENHHGVTEFTE